jgi:exopolyphosphatase/guanosine-5'-triphosphate,3'-diphosphate pyrophosphatase
MTAVPLHESRERLAAIDVGSNSIRLLVADYGPVSGITVVDEVKEQPRLAAGLAETGRLDPASMERALLALHRIREVCDRRGVSRIAAVATAAVREASNGADFARLVRDEIGIHLQVIDPDAEANLSYRSVAYHFPLAGSRTVVADIGGGSLELISAVDGLVERSLSLPFGAVRLTELHLTGGNERKGVRELRSYLRHRFRRLLPMRDWSAATIIGSGGSFTNLGRMAAARRGAPVNDPVHGASVSAAEVDHLLEWLASLPRERRQEVPGLNPQRADIILAGLAVTAELLERIEAREVKISAFGLREGLLLEMAAADAVPASADPLRLAREFAERCHCDRRHSEQVRTLALALFDQLGEKLGATPEERALLETAALLHDVGQMVTYRRYHRHSYELIMHAERLHLSARDRLLVALICRYHRKRGPKRKDPEYGALDPADRAVVRRLSGILRVAEGLDRGYTSIVAGVITEVCPTRITIRPVPREAGADLALECWGAGQNADVLSKALKLEVVVEPAPEPVQLREATPA